MGFDDPTDKGKTMREEQRQDTRPTRRHADEHPCILASVCSWYRSLDVSLSWQTTACFIDDRGVLLACERLFFFTSNWLYFLQYANCFLIRFHIHDAISFTASVYLHLDLQYSPFFLLVVCLSMLGTTGNSLKTTLTKEVSIYNCKYKRNPCLSMSMPTTRVLYAQ